MANDWNASLRPRSFAEVVRLVILVFLGVVVILLIGEGKALLRRDPAVFIPVTRTVTRVFVPDTSETRRSAVSAELPSPGEASLGSAREVRSINEESAVPRVWAYALQLGLLAFVLGMVLWTMGHLSREE